MAAAREAIGPYVTVVHGADADRIHDGPTRARDTGFKCAPVARQWPRDLVGFGRIWPDRQSTLYPCYWCRNDDSALTRSRPGPTSNPRSGTPRCAALSVSALRLRCRTGASARARQWGVPRALLGALTRGLKRLPLPARPPGGSMPSAHVAQSWREWLAAVWRSRMAVVPQASHAPQMNT